MTNDPDQIRDEIEDTRRELGSDVNALADKVRPSSIAHRQRDKLKGAMGRTRDTVMGRADNAAHAVGEAPRRAAETTRGNPIAVGLMAFGAGMLAASLLPASRKERELANSAKDLAAPAVDNLKESAQTVAEDMKEPAREAAESVRGAAQDAAGRVKESSSGTGQPTSPDTGQQPPGTTPGGYGVSGSSPTAPRDPLSSGGTGV